MAYLEFFVFRRSSGCALSFAWVIHTEICAEGIRDNKVGTEIVAALRRALFDENSRSLFTFKIFTFAIAQGALRRFHRLFILKFLQRAFATRYLTPWWSLHLNVHWVIKISTSEAAHSNSSLLP